MKTDLYFVNIDRFVMSLRVYTGKRNAKDGILNILVLFIAQCIDVTSTVANTLLDIQLRLVVSLVIFFVS